MFQKKISRSLATWAVFLLVLSVSMMGVKGTIVEAANQPWVVPHVYEQRTFQVSGKGVSSEVAAKQLRTTWSRYESTGIFVNQNEKITLNVATNAKVFAYIQSYALHGSGDSWDEQQFKLQAGKNEITPRKSGILYLANEEVVGSISVSITGGSHIPVFEKGTHKKDDLNKMLAKYPTAPYVEYISERGLITVTYASVAKYMAQKDATNPEEMVNNLDVFLAAQDKVAGYDELEGVHKQDRHYRHLIQDTKHSLYMYSTMYRTAYVNDAINSVLSGLKKDAWGPWHENGHQQQQSTLNFHNMVEVQVNVFSLAAEKALGFEKSRLEAENVYPKIMNYLNLPKEQKNYDELEDLFVKLGMLHQLTLSFGEQFYPKLYRAYRETPRDEIPVMGKDQIFMYMASKTAGYDLHLFFEMWGMKMSNDTRIELQKSNLVPLQQEIWKSTDKTPIVVPILTLEPEKISFTMSRELYDNKRIVVLRNGAYVYETYQGTTYYGTTNNSDANNITISSNKLSLAYGDVVDVYDIPGRPGDGIDQSKGTHLISRKMTGETPLTVDATGFSSNMNLDLFNSQNRVVFFHNGNYAGETYEGTNYYLSGKTENNIRTIDKKMTLASGDTIKMYLLPGKPGSILDLTQGVLLATKTHLTKTPLNSFGTVSMEMKASEFTVSVPRELYAGDQRVVVAYNGHYALEFYKGNTYYGTKTDTTNLSIVKITKMMPLKAGDEVSVYTVPGGPGNSTDLYDMTNLLLNKKF